MYIQCDSKSNPLNFLQYFTQANCYISVKFCKFVANLYPHIFTNYGRFILIFNKTALIFLGMLIFFNVSHFEFHQVRLP